MAGIKRTLFLKQGEDFEQPIVITVDGEPDGEPEDITDWVVEAQIRGAASDDDPVATLTAIITDGPAGKVSLFLSSSQTADIPAGDSLSDLASRYQWDCFVTPPSGSRKALFRKAPVIVESSITR